MTEFIERVGRAIVRANWEATYGDSPCPDDTPGTLATAEAVAATNEIITVLYENGEGQAASVLRDQGKDETMDEQYEDDLAQLIVTARDRGVSIEDIIEALDTLIFTLRQVLKVCPMEATHETLLRKCQNPTCDEYFTYGPGTGRRETRRYHSPQCQNRHTYLKRKEAAK
tara:strand:- start:190 stop:699 length:510 start_codon:yes stop_codon:yes gene_type:complete